MTRLRGWIAEARVFIVENEVDKFLPGVIAKPGIFQLSQVKWTLNVCVCT